MIERDRIVTIFGGSGFIGRYVCEQLLDAGVRIRVASRNPRTAYYLQTLAQVGQWGAVRADVTNRQSVREAVAGADAVVNLVGSFENMAKVQAQGAATIAKAASEAGTRSLVHISSIAADSSSEATYSRTKSEGEDLVRKAFPNATIIRPSIVFGREDQLTNRLAAMSRLPVLPVVAPESRSQPVFVEDLAKAITAAALDPASHAGNTYEIGGPQVFTMRELVQQILAAAGRQTALADVPAPISSLISWFGFLPGAPLTRDQWLMLQRDNVASSDSTGLEAFGIKPTPFAAVAPKWLGMYGGNRFARRRVNLTANT